MVFPAYAGLIPTPRARAILRMRVFPAYAGLIPLLALTLGLVSLSIPRLCGVDSSASRHMTNENAGSIPRLYGVDSRAVLKSPTYAPSIPRLCGVDSAGGTGKSSFEAGVPRLCGVDSDHAVCV